MPTNRIVSQHILLFYFEIGQTLSRAAKQCKCHHANSQIGSLECGKCAAVIKFQEVSVSAALFIPLWYEITSLNRCQYYVFKEKFWSLLDIKNSPCVEEYIKAPEWKSLPFSSDWFKNIHKNQTRPRSRRWHDFTIKRQLGLKVCEEWGATEKHVKTLIMT